MTADPKCLEGMMGPPQPQAFPPHPATGEKQPDAVMVPREPTDAMIRAVMEDRDTWRKVPHFETQIRLQWVAMISAAPSAPADGWRDISTAPTDKSVFLAWCPPDADFPAGRMMQWAGWLLAQARHSDKTPRHLTFPATHWMPLPAPPKQGGQP